MGYDIAFWYIIYAVLAIIALYLFIVGLRSDWFNALVMPDWQPTIPATVIIWIIVYGLSYIGLFMIYRDQIKYHKGYLQASSISYLFALNLIILLLLVLWIIVFFHLQSIIGALVILVFMAIFGLYYLYFVYELNKIAALLHIPFLLWLIFYVVLGAQYLILNPTV